MFQRSLLNDSRIERLGRAQMAECRTSNLSDEPIDTLLGEVSYRACRTSFHRLRNLTSGRLLSVICRINRDRAEPEEVLQETYVLIWNRFGTDLARPVDVGFEK